MGIDKRKKVEYLIVDTSAFINNAALQEIGEHIITVPEVVNEIKSKRQLKRLVVLPYDLQIKDSQPENVKFVNEFSKKTGDYTSLSATDVSVIALTYQLEKEKNGSDHLNTAPVQKATIEPFNSTPEDLKNIVGFHLPKKHSKSRLNSQSNDQDDCESSEDEFEDAAEELKSSDGDLSEGDEDETEVGGNEVEEDGRPEEPLDLIKEGEEDEEEEEEEGEWEEGSDDESDWITPCNVESVKAKIASEVTDDFQNISVACLTTDYAMQNVLKQIGLHVVSIDGKLIKQLRTFILRCYGCFKTTSIMTKVFCPNCGNKTLKKVGVSLNADGTQRLHINFRRPLTARGKRFSLPLPKGGKHSNNPILCEDQPMPQQRASRLSKTKNNPLNDDYIAGYSPFVMRDVTSKSAMLGIRPHIEMKNWMRRNPNQNRRKKK